MTILEVITGAAPWSELRGGQIILATAKGWRPKRPYFLLQDEQTNRVWDLITQCWEQEPMNRPTAVEVRDRLNAIIATADMHVEGPYETQG
ncbi:hypothetical protein RSAG8_03473, partial [Rhizoctonia solani AG-8 WAC10335]